MNERVKRKGETYINEKIHNERIEILKISELIMRKRDKSNWVNKLNEETKKLKEKDDKINELTIELGEIEFEKVELEEKIVELEEKIVEFEEKLSEKYDDDCGIDLHYYEEVIKEKDDEIKELKKEVKKYKNEKYVIKKSENIIKKFLINNIRKMKKIKNKENKDLITLVKEIAYDILNEVGPGHTECVYHNAMKIALQDANYKFETERNIIIKFRGRYVGTVRADLIIDNRLVIELKSCSGTDKILSDAMQQCKIYMKETKISYGVVIVFPKSICNKLIVQPLNNL
jgi:GxxExxY protein